MIWVLVKLRVTEILKITKKEQMNKVLVIDDSEVNLYLVQTIFDDDPQVQVDIESDSRKALSLLREGYPDVLVLDLMMPHVDGYQLLHEIKADPGLSQIPILVISAKLDKDSYDQVLKYGVQGYYKKPIQLKEVEMEIRKLFNK